MADNMDDDKIKNPAPGTGTGEPNPGNPQATPPVNNNGGSGEGTPFKTFSTKEEFDNHSAGIRTSAEKKVEKEFLAMLGLKPDEKEKLSKFKEAYESTLSEAEKQTEKMNGLENEVAVLKAQIAEKDAIISALGKLNEKDFGDISKYVKMAKGLVDENTSMDEAMTQVLAMVKQEKKPVPTGTPPDKGSTAQNEKNPFKSDNLTEQGKAIRMDKEQARKWYYEAYGKYPNW